MSDRIYTRAFEVNRASPVFNYVEDPSLNGGSGAWAPMKGELVYQTPNASQNHGYVTFPTGSAVNFTGLFPLNQNTKSAQVQIDGSDIRFVLNPSTPSSIIGLKAINGDVLALSRTEMESMKMYALGPASGILQIISYEN